jgi:hypothetical protein
MYRPSEPRGSRRTFLKGASAAAATAAMAARPAAAGVHVAGSDVIKVGQLACDNGTPITREEMTRSTLGFGPPPEASTFATPPPSVPDAMGNYPLPVPGVSRFL